MKKGQNQVNENSLINNISNITLQIINIEKQLCD